jgi:hypothetical protein
MMFIYFNKYFYLENFIPFGQLVQELQLLVVIMAVATLKKYAIPTTRIAWGDGFSG